jgi:hypothetical protein
MYLIAPATFLHLSYSYAPPCGPADDFRGLPQGVTHVLRAVPYTDPRNDAAGTVDGELTADGQQAGGVFSVSGQRP